VAGTDFAAIGPMWVLPPVQKPYPPIWIGGNGVTARRRVVEHGSGWMPLIAAPAVALTIGTQELTNAVEFGLAASELTARLEAAGRDAFLWFYDPDGNEFEFCRAFAVP
jgi:alkanesulfonate monooxygenase SsuD/methylene tetrahydromethanopterin reductase-like flavin-dependent oxidoreductase (luciferase family)